MKKNKKVSVKDIIAKEGFIIYPIKGTSMLPLLREGVDQVHLVKSDEYNIFDVVLFQSSKTSYILHRIIGKVDDKYAIIGDNSFRVDYKTKDEIIAKMAGFYQQDKYIDLKDEMYQNYMEKYILPKEKEYPELIKNPEEYFFNRFKDAVYEVYRFGYDNAYDFDPNKFNKLAVSEKRRFISIITEKKAAHMFGGMISKRDQYDIPTKVKKFFINEFEVSKLRYIRILEAKTAISNALTKEGIRHIYLKGTEIRSLYKVKHMRWSNDIDLYVDVKDHKKAIEVFEKVLNCTYFAESIQHIVFESELYKLHFEMHGTISAFFPKDLKRLLKDPFEHAIQDRHYEARYHLDPTHFYLHHLAHMISHTSGGEFWSHMYLDTYILNHRKEVDYQVIEEARLGEFNTVMTHISDSIFDPTIELTEEEKAFEKVLFKNSGEILGAVQKGNTKNSFKYVWRRLFPKYASMKFMYPVLKKAPILLPFCYIARVLSLFGKGKFKKGTEQLSAYNNAKDQEIKVFYNAGLKEYLESKHDAM